MGMRHDDPINGPLLTLIHFCVLYYFSNVFPSCVFSSLADDINIFNPTHVVPLTYDHFSFQLAFVALVV
jgi:hypothetical protein